MITIEAMDEPDSEWNKRLLQSHVGTVQNTKDFVMSINRQLGLPIKPVFLRFLDSKGKIVGQMAITTYPRFYKKGIKQIFNLFPSVKKNVYSWKYSPVIFEPELTEDICKKLKNFLISKNCRVSGSEHPLQPDSLKTMKDPFTINKWSTFLLDLSKGEESLWEKMDKHSVRKNIERTEKRGVYVKQIDRSELELYRQLRVEKDLKLGYDVLALETLQKTWDTLKGVGWTGFIAFKDEKPISALMITFFNGFINEWGVARGEQKISPKVYPQDLLKWEIIKWASKKKFRYYDLTGTNPIPTTEKEKGIFQYKKKWGGDLVKYNLIKL